MTDTANAADSPLGMETANPLTRVLRATQPRGRLEPAPDISSGGARRRRGGDPETAAAEGSVGPSGVAARTDGIDAGDATF